MSALKELAIITTQYHSYPNFKNNIELKMFKFNRLFEIRNKASANKILFVILLLISFYTFAPSKENILRWHI